MTKYIKILIFCLSLNIINLISAAQNENGSKNNPNNKTELTKSERRISGAIDLLWGAFLGYIAFHNYKVAAYANRNWQTMETAFPSKSLPLVHIGGKKQIYVSGLLSTLAAVGSLSSFHDAYKNLVSVEKVYKN